MTLQIINNNYKSVSIILYVEHPDKYSSNKHISLVDVSNVLKDKLLDYSFYKTNLYENEPNKLLINILKTSTHNGNCTFTYSNFLPYKSLIKDFLKNHTLSNFVINYPYEENSTKYIDSYSIDNLFYLISRILREISDNMYKVFNVRYIEHSSKPDCIEFRLNLEVLYKYLPVNYKYNYPFELHLAYSFMLIWCANTVFYWLNDLRLIGNDSGVFSSFSVKNTKFDYIVELRKFIKDRIDIKQILVDTAFNTLFEVCNNSICSKFECSCAIALPCSTFNLFNELSQLSNTNHFYTTKHNNHNFEMVIYDSTFIPECRKYLSCMTPDIPVIMTPDISGSVIKSNRKVNPEIRLTVKEDKTFQNVIHCNIEVNNSIGFHNLISSPDNNINDSITDEIAENNDYSNKSNIYACTLLFSFRDLPSNLAILLLCSYCLYNPNVEYIEHHSVGLNFLRNEFPENKNSENIRYTHYKFKALVESFYDLFRVDEVEMYLKKVFKCAPHNRYTTIMKGIKCETLKEFKQYIKEAFKDLRNVNDLDNDFAKAYKVLQKKLLSLKYVNVINGLVRYAQEVISC